MKTYDPLVELKKALQGKSQAKFCRENGISTQYLSDVLNEKKGAGELILSALKLRRVVNYVRDEK